MMALNLSLSAPIAPVLRRPRRASHRIRAVAAQEEAIKETSGGSSSGKEKIYVGKGKFIEDDPSKYPSRTALTGGFAGGEVGLKQFVAELGDSAKVVKKTEGSQTSASPSNKGGLYVGKGKYLPKERSNLSTVVAQTGRDSTLTGGFTGGEVGLRAFVETGEVPFAPPGSTRRQQSPLIVAGIVSAAAVTGGILLDDVTDVGERFVSGAGAVGAAASPGVLSGLDENTKLLLEVGVAVFGLLTTVVGGQAIVGSLTNSIKDGAAKLATLAVFWVVVFIAARLILES